MSEENISEAISEATSEDRAKFITWVFDRPSGLNWVVFQPANLAGSQPPEDGVVPSGEELGEYETYVAARRAHPEARITNSAAEAIKYGNL